MARKRQVTRTIKTKYVEYLGINTSTMKTFNGVQPVPFEVADDKIEKTVRELVNSDTVKLVDILGTTIKTEHRGMLEEDFIANSYIIEDDKSDE